MPRCGMRASTTTGGGTATIAFQKAATGEDPQLAQCSTSFRRLPDRKSHRPPIIIRQTSNQTAIPVPVEMIVAMLLIALKAYSTRARCQFLSKTGAGRFFLVLLKTSISPVISGYPKFQLDSSTLVTQPMRTPRWFTPNQRLPAAIREPPATGPNRQLHRSVLVIEFSDHPHPTVLTRLQCRP